MRDVCSIRSARRLHSVRSAGIMPDCAAAAVAACCCCILIGLASTLSHVLLSPILPCGTVRPAWVRQQPDAEPLARLVLIRLTACKPGLAAPHCKAHATSVLRASVAAAVALVALPYLHIFLFLQSHTSSHRESFPTSLPMLGSSACDSLWPTFDKSTDGCR